MKILDKYLLKSISKASLITLFSLVFIFAFFQFIEELDEVGKKDYNLNAALQYILLLFPSYFNSLIVLSLMIGVVFSVGQLNSDKELQIFHTASVSQWALIKKTLKYSFFISVVLIIFLELITPQTLTFANQIKDHALGRNSFQNTSDAWFRKDNEILFLRKDKNSNYDFKLFLTKDNHLLSFMDGKGAFFSGNDLITGESGKIEFQNNGNFIAPIGSFSKAEIKFNLNSEEVGSLSKNVKTMSFVDLLKMTSTPYQNQSKENEIILEIISRVIKPLTLLEMILLAIPFILNFQRNISIGKRVFVSIILGSTTHLFTKITSVISLKFDEMVIVGPILPTIILFLIGVLILRNKINF